MRSTTIALDLSSYILLSFECAPDTLDSCAALDPVERSVGHSTPASSDRQSALVRCYWLGLGRERSVRP